MSRITKSLRVVSILGAGVLCGLGLSVGPTVQADREIDATDAVAAVAPAPLGDNAPWRDAKLFAEVLEHVRKEYVEDVSDHELIEAAIRGMMADLDPHSAYLGPAEFDEIRISSTGEYSGVGIEVALENGVVKVISPIEDTPAFRAGVLAGDRILAVDDVPVNSESLNDTIDRMRGRVGTAVKITIARSPDPKPMEFMLSRASVQVHSVTQQMLEPGLGYVKISHFSETTTPDLEAAIGKLKKASAGKLRGMVLDLRNNPGGVLEAAIGVSDVFLDSGLIVTANGRAPDALLLEVFKWYMAAQKGGASIEGVLDRAIASAQQAAA